MDILETLLKALDAVPYVLFFVCFLHADIKNIEITINAPKKRNRRKRK